MTPSIPERIRNTWILRLKLKTVSSEIFSNIMCVCTYVSVSVSVSVCVCVCV